MAEIVSFLNAHAQRGRGIIFHRRQYRKTDVVRVKLTGAIGSFVGYITDGPSCGKCKVFIAGAMHFLDQDAIELHCAVGGVVMREIECEAMP